MVNRRAAAALLVLSLIASACTGDGEPAQTGGGQPDLRGGTLRVGIIGGLAAQIKQRRFLDPQAPFSEASEQREFLRCCLTRTLLSYTGRPTSEGGIVLHPDLATALPEISDDRLTWTFHLVRGIRYAPPFDDVEITTPDIVRALERTATPAIGTQESVAMYEPIDGVREFADGRASTIGGLETPDPYTLRVHLTEVTNDLGYRFALPATAPIPPSPTDSSARFGAAEGHDDGYGRFMASSGPYMIEGAQELDPSLPPGAQRPVTGLVAGESLTLVRNPSWSRQTDELREAYVDRVEVRVVRLSEAWRAIDDGTLDVIYNGAPSPEQLERYESDPELRDRVFRETCNFVAFVSMRLVAPPFDDVHVRRAANYALDLDRMAKIASTYRWGALGFFRFSPIGHVAPDSTEADLLAGWDPYRFDLAKAQEEMSKSRYDADHDGVCDHASCRRVVMFDTNFGPDPALAAVLAKGLRAIGIGLDVRFMRMNRLEELVPDPRERPQLTFTTTWEAVYPSPSPLFGSAFDVAGIGSFPTTNYSLIGVSEEQLAGWGYALTSVPSVGVKIGECRGLIGPAQQQCWAELDQLLMLQIVPAIPALIEEDIRIVSDHVTRYSFDQPFGNKPALDQIAVAPG